ncbi:hypothetical protein MTO96_044699, partial [Rhipicephalus appendiculatus]
MKNVRTSTRGEDTKQSKRCAARHEQLLASFMQWALALDELTRSSSGRISQVQRQGLVTGSYQGAVAGGTFVAEAIQGPVGMLDYISADRGKGLAILSVRPEGTTDWVQKLYDVSVSSTAPAVLQYTEFDAPENASAPVNYQVLFLAVNSCYIVEKTKRTTPPSVVDRSGKTQSK